MDFDTGFIIFIGINLVALFLVTSSQLNIGDKENSGYKLTDFEIKADLVNRFKPGTCRGMPTVITEDLIDKFIKDHPELAEKVRNRYSVRTDSQVYGKMRQFQNIDIKKYNSSSYSFKVVDGQCCSIKTYKGFYWPETSKLDITENSTKIVPC